MRKLVSVLRRLGPALGGAVVLCLGGAAPAAVPIIPAPASAEAKPGRFEVTDETWVAAVIPADAGAQRAADYFQELVARTRGLNLRTGHRGGWPAIGFRSTKEPALGAEGYRLEVSELGIRVTAATEAGLFYGAGSLWQLMTADGGRGPVTLQGMTIVDAPRFAWRGLMLDSARHYQSPAYMRRLIDVMALHKLNVLHWHLTDDQAWRLEIRKYPRLTEVGAWRVPAGAAAKDIDQATAKPRLYGGFYSQHEVRDLVAYAAARHITIVPEIEMPGHALAPIVAYPHLGAAPAPATVSADWGVFPYLYNVDESTFAWLEDVLGEVMDLFPGRFIHIGGDEAVKDQWKASPRVQARMRELGLKDEAALQGYFTARIARFLAKNGRRAIGWDEILEGGLPEGAAVMSWRGVDGATIAAKRGHDAVLAAWPTLYLDNLQSGSPAEPPGRGRVLGLKEVYAFEPMPADLPDAQQRHILGLQANLWTEHVRTEARADHMTWPREAAVAEIGWSPAAARDWPRFLDRLKPWMARYASLGVAASDAAFRPEPAPGPASLVRASQELKTCADKLVLSLEDDAPIRGDRAVFLIDIMQPCWRWEAAPMDGVTGLSVRVGQVPFNFQIGADREKIVLAPPRSPEGELEVRLCGGEVIASIPLKPAAANPAVTQLSVPFRPAQGLRDLCFAFTGKDLDPMWALDRVELTRGRP